MLNGRIACGCLSPTSHSSSTATGNTFHNTHWDGVACYALSPSDGQAPVDDGPKLTYAEISEHGH